VRALGEVPPPGAEPIAPIELPASALIEESHEPATSRPGRSAVWDDEARAASPTSRPSVVEAAEAPPIAAGNRVAFETWVRRLGGKR
jgi:hypothetical protein